MLLRKFLAVSVALAFILSVISISAFAGGEEKEDKDGKVSWTWVDEQGHAAVGSPVHWTRTVTVLNDGKKEKKIEIKKFPKHTDFFETNSDLKYKKKHVEYNAPVGTSAVVIEYETPAPTATIKVTANNATHYLFDFVIDADTDVHYSDVDMPVDVPGTSWDWNYFINWKQPDGSLAQQRLYAANTDGDKKTYEKIGWRAPHLSTQQGGGGGQKSESKIRNYDFETTRANNASLPELWFMKGLLGTELVDDLPWPYNPLTAGLTSQTALLIKHADVQDGRIYAEPINGTDSTFSIAISYNPTFSGDYCEFNGGAEILFGDGTGDTTYGFSIRTDGTVAVADEFTYRTLDLIQGWKLLVLNSTVSVPSDQYIRLYFSTEDCWNNLNSNYVIDNILIL